MSKQDELKAVAQNRITVGKHRPQSENQSTRKQQEGCEGNSPGGEDEGSEQRS